MIPTAEEFLQNNDDYSHIDDSRDKVYFDFHVEQNMIKFTKLHVEAALKAASEKAKTKEDIAIFAEGTYRTQIVDKYSILNAYPLENIK